MHGPLVFGVGKVDEGLVGEGRLRSAHGKGRSQFKSSHSVSILARGMGSRRLGLDAVSVARRFVSVQLALRELLGGFGHLGGALELVPVEGLAVDGALHGLEQHDGEDLAIGEALNPDVEEQPGVALAGGVLPFEREGEGGGGEVDEQEGEEEDQQLVEAVRGAALGMEVLVDEVVDDAGDEHEVDERRDERQKDLEDEDVGQCEEAHGAVLANGATMLADRLQDAEGPAEALAHQAVWR